MTNNEIKERIADLELDLSWSDGDEKEKLVLEIENLKRDLYERDLEAKAAKKPFTIARLDRLDAEKSVFDSHINQMARDIAAFRGEEIPNGYHFDRFERTTADGWAIRDWPKGTRLIRAIYEQWFCGDCNVHTVLFPESYLDEDWHPQEQERRDERETTQQKVARERAEAAEAKRRAEYERLHKIYGDKK